MPKIIENDVNSIIKDLKNGIKLYRDSDNYREMLDTMSKFYLYSFHNQCLIASQQKTATYCGSIKFWNSLGRYVKKGEKGLKILLPVPYQTEFNVKDKNGEQVYDKEGNPIVKKIEGLNFKVGNTFDISQTFGKELNLGCKELVGEDLKVKEIISALKEISGAKDIVIENTGSDTKGYYKLDSKEIVINSGMSDFQTVKTAMHESAHSIVFNDYDVEKIDRQDHEIIAESVAYVVCKRFGLDTSEYSFNYVNNWAMEDDSRIENCINYISKTSTKIIKGLEKTLGLKFELDIKKSCDNKKTQEYSKTKTNKNIKKYKKGISK